MGYTGLITRLRTATTLPVMNALCQEAADAIEELSKPNWISVEERLPTVDEEVIVFAYGSMMRIWSLHRLDQETADVCWECEDGTWDDVCVVTHWMPLPELPKEET